MSARRLFMRSIKSRRKRNAACDDAELLGRFACISFPSREIRKRNQGIHQCLHWFMQAPAGACGHDSNPPNYPYMQNNHPKRDGCFAWSCWADSKWLLNLLNRVL